MRLLDSEFQVSSFKFQVARGFTIVELLIVMAIISLLLGFSIPAYNNFNANQKRQQSGLSLMQTLRDVQNRATNGDKAKLCPVSSPAPPPGNPTTDSFDGWYVLLDTSGSNNINNSYTMGAICGATPNAGISTDVLSTVKTVKFDSPSIVIQSLSIGGSISKVYIVFQPLGKSVTFYTPSITTANQIVATEANITLQEGTSITKQFKIKVTATGSIYQNE